MDDMYISILLITGHGVKCSVSMESMVSLSDIELGEGDDIGSHAHIAGRYIEDYDHGEEDEGDDEEQNMIQRNVSRTYSQIPFVVIRIWTPQ